MFEVDVVELEIVKKYSVLLESTHAYGIEGSKEIFKRMISKSNVEKVCLICLDSTNKIINTSIISIGNIDSVKVSLSEIFKIALLSNASKICVAHNHPSGILEMTSNDIKITKNIGIMANVFDIEFIDSYIINSKGEIISIREDIKNEYK